MGTPTVGIPHAYRDRVEAEHKRLGSDSKIQTMTHILDVYFGTVEPNRAPNVNGGVQADAASEMPPPPATPSEKKRIEREVQRYYVIP